MSSTRTETRTPPSPSPCAPGRKRTPTLGFYTYLDGRWQRAADARLDSGRQRAEADFAPLPKNLAVLRVVAQAYQVAASLPSGGTLHPDAKAGIVSPRDYEPVSDGALEGTATEVEVGDGGLLIPTIVGSGQDTAAVVNDILADDSLRQQHIDAIVQLAKDGGFAGIDLEYSSVDPDLREEFTSFAQALGKALRDDGRRLSLTLPPPGPQREAYDWPLLGQAADIIKILPIADPLGYWETMPDALTKLVEDVDPKKVMLVVSPFSAQIAEGGDTKALGYLQAMLLASEIKVREPADPADIKTDVGVKVVAVNLDSVRGRDRSPLERRRGRPLLLLRRARQEDGLHRERVQRRLQAGARPGVRPGRRLRLRRLRARPTWRTSGPPSTSSSSPAPSRWCGRTATRWCRAGSPRTAVTWTPPPAPPSSGAPTRPAPTSSGCSSAMATGASAASSRSR